MKMSRELGWKTLVCGGNPVSLHFTHHKSQTNWPQLEAGMISESIVTNDNSIMAFNPSASPSTRGIDLCFFIRYWPLYVV